MTQANGLDKQHSLLADAIRNAFMNQDATNCKVKDASGIAVGGEWKSKGWPYYRASWTEAAEAINHINWFWWKTGKYLAPLTVEEMSEVHMELCDILHFMLSQDLVYFSDHPKKIGAQEARVQEYINAFQEAENGRNRGIEYELEDFIVVTILSKATLSPVKQFARACAAANLSVEGLLLHYSGKSALNEFRWNNGYNQKTYIKMWNPTPDLTEPAEDNTFLSEILRKVLKRTPKDQVLSAIVDGTAVDGIKTRLAELYSLTLANRFS